MYDLFRAMQTPNRVLRRWVNCTNSAIPVGTGIYFYKITSGMSDGVLFTFLPVVYFLSKPRLEWIIPCIFLMRCSILYSSVKFFLNICWFKPSSVFLHSLHYAWCLNVFTCYEQRELTWRKHGPTSELWAIEFQGGFPVVKINENNWKLLMSGSVITGTFSDVLRWKQVQKLYTNLSLIVGKKCWNVNYNKCPIF